MGAFPFSKLPMAFARRAIDAIDVPARAIATTAAVAAAAAVLGLVTLVLVTYVRVIPDIQGALSPRFDPPPVVDTGEALLSFTRAGLLAAFAVLAPPALRWDGASNAGPRTYQPATADFVATTTASTYDISLVPGPLAGQACAHAANVSFDARGFVDTCTSSPAPGTPFGAATLDFTGVVPIAQLPPFLYAGPTFLGYWNAANNTPFLTNATCGATDDFYYVVSDAGSVPLGPHSDWHPLDQAVCYNGTWDHVAPSAFDELDGTPNQIGVTCVGRTCTLSLPQDIATNSTPTFAGLFVGLDGVVPASPSTGSQFPLPSNAGAAGQVYKRTATGAQWEDARLEAAVGVNGIQIAPINGTVDAVGIDPAGAFTADAATLHQVVYSNAADTFSTATGAALGLAQNTQLRWPPTNGASGNVLVGDGAGNLAYGVNGAALAWYRTTAPAAVTGAGFQSLYGAGAGSRTIPANTLRPNTRIGYKLACTYVTGAGSVTVRVVLGATTLVTASAFTGASAPLMIEGSAWVTNAGQMVATGAAYRSTTPVSLLVQPSPVAFAPASALAFDVQSSQGGAVVTCTGTMEVYAWAA